METTDSRGSYRDASEGENLTGELKLGFFLTTGKLTVHVPLKIKGWEDVFPSERLALFRGHGGVGNF